MRSSQKKGIGLGQRGRLWSPVGRVWVRSVIGFDGRGVSRSLEWWRAASSRLAQGALIVKRRPTHSRSFLAPPSRRSKAAQRLDLAPRLTPWPCVALTRASDARGGRLTSDLHAGYMRPEITLRLQAGLRSCGTCPKQVYFSCLTRYAAKQWAQQA